MEQSGPDMNAAIWQSPEIIRNWAAEAARQEPKRAAQRRLMALLLASRRQHRTPEEQARWENHVRYIIPLAQQLGYLRSAGFPGIDVYWKQLDNVIYGGCRPAD
jgi:hypothetical protein